MAIFSRHARILIALLVVCFAHHELFAQDATNDSVFQSIKSQIEQLANKHLDVAQLQTTGYSTENRPLLTLILKDNKSKPKPAIFVNGAHHGNETVTAQCVLNFAQKLIEDHQINPLTSRLLHFDFYLMPIANPDGFVRGSRFESTGFDLNRDYPNKKLGYQGFTLPESKAIGRLLARVPFLAAVSVHSGFKGVLWPWGYSRQSPPKARIFKDLAETMAKAMNHNVFKQSYFDYPTRGEFIDYAYSEHGILAFTLEVDEAIEVRSDRWPSVSENTARGLLAMTDRLISSKDLAINDSGSRL